jgi:hypothetical protein
MANYGGIQKEETLKSLVHEDYFSRFGYEPNIDNIDFVVTDKKARDDLFSDSHGSSCHYLWAEAKKGSHDVFAMFTQLVLTCKKTYEKAEYLAPPWLGVFDEARISFAAFHDMLPVFTETDFNWNVTPSNHEAADFQKAREKVKNLIGAKIVSFSFGTDDRDIKEFIKTHFTGNGAASVKSPITKDNFVQIFNKWVKEVMPSIDIQKELWADFKQKGILACDFYRADVMSEGGNTITEKLKIVLKNDKYQLHKTIDYLQFTADIRFADNGDAYSRFWNKYERPPAPVYQQFIIDRRDLLVPQNIREVKGSFFTPKIWADKSKEYLAAVFGDNWQEEYYIWDCAAGTGNLLAGLVNKYNVWASDIDAGNIETMRSLVDIDESLDLLDAHIFQFDFLNDSFDKLPEGLRNIINDPEKRKKLIVYINPPYAEATSTKTTSGTGHNKPKVAVLHKTRTKYQSVIGAATNEISAQFMVRIYYEIPACKLALFSKLKFVNGQNFVKFREFFKADFKNGFAVHASTFDNVTGKFPIGFTVWDLCGNNFPKSIVLDIVESKGKKEFWALNGKSINKWIVQFNKTVHEGIAYMANPAPDFQRINQPYITMLPGIRHFHYYVFNCNNIIEGCIYLAVRLCIEPTWLNDRDQFLFPNDGWKSDTEFQHNSLIFTLFHGQNRISSQHGVNHWIPYTEKEVDAKERFESNFMSELLKRKTLSPEAQSVLDAGRDLWQYYHAKIKNDKTTSVNASFYDIREFFQGRNENGTMNTKSDDETYNSLIKTLREKHKELAKKIEPKIYLYGFLK